MSRQTTNYGYNISEGTDLVNPLVDIFPNWETLDSDLKNVSDDAVGRATELTTGTVHALTRSDTDRNVFVFTATSNFTAGDTFTLDGTQVSALTPAGEQLATGCYIIGSDVLVAVHGTLMTMYVSPTKVADSDKLDGHDSTYFATASDVSDLSDDLDVVSDKVGTGVLTTTAQDCVGAINELNSDLSWKHIGDSAGSGVGGSENAISVSKTYREIAIVISPNPTSNKHTNVMVIPMIALTSLSNYAQPRQLTGGHYYTPTAGANSLSYGINATSNDNNFDIKVDWMASNGADKSHEYYLQVYAR